MAIVVTTPESLVATARQQLVDEGVVDDSSAFVADDGDEVAGLGGVVHDFAAVVWLKESRQNAGDVNTEPPTDEIPVVEGDLVVSAFVRIDSDQTGRSSVAHADQSRGIQAFVRRITRALNDRDLVDGADTLTMESLTFRRASNRGRVRGQDRWRRVDVSFDLMYRWALATADDPSFVLAESGSSILSESGSVIETEG